MSKCSKHDFFSFTNGVKLHQNRTQTISLSHTTRDKLPYHMQLLHMYTQNEEMNDMANEMIQHKLIQQLKIGQLHSRTFPITN